MKVTGILCPSFQTKIEKSTNKTRLSNGLAYTFGYRTNEIRMGEDIFVKTELATHLKYLTVVVFAFVILGGVFFWGDPNGIGLSLTFGGIAGAILSAMLSYVLGKRQHLIVLSRLRGDTV